MNNGHVVESHDGQILLGDSFNVQVPSASSFRGDIPPERSATTTRNNENGDKLVGLIFDRTCPLWPAAYAMLPLLCFYTSSQHGNGREIFAFKGCVKINSSSEVEWQTFQNGPFDPFFTEGQKVYYTTAMTLKYEEFVERGVSSVFIDTDNSCVFTSSCKNNKTDQELVVIKYITGLFQKNYFSFYYDLALNVEYEVAALAFTYMGRDTVFAYQLLGDPDISDEFELISIVGQIEQFQQGNVILSKKKFINKSLQIAPPNNEFQQDHIEVYMFNEYNQIALIKNYIDLLTVSFYLPQDFGTPNISLTCSRIVFEDCLGDLAPYSTYQECVDFMTSIPLQDANGQLSPVADNTVKCRAFHEVLARALPSVHCPHTGPQCVDIEMNPCCTEFSGKKRSVEEIQEHRTRMLYEVAKGIKNGDYKKKVV